MTKPEDSRKNIIMLATTAAITLILALIVLFAALAPPSPERVVSNMLESIAQQDANELEKFAGGSALTSLKAASVSQDNSPWRNYWDNGAILFEDFRIGAIERSGDQASVLVYYGPGLILDAEFILRRENRHWKVIDLTD